MMANLDRTEIVRLLMNIWPELVKMSSGQVHAFLNEKTKTDVDVDIPNPVAFDIWRKAIAAQTEHKHVWPYTQEYLDTVQLKSKQMKDDEEKRQQAVKEKFGDAHS